MDTGMLEASRALENVPKEGRMTVTSKRDPSIFLKKVRIATSAPPRSGL
jgi:hypothetical protein